MVEYEVLLVASAVKEFHALPGEVKRRLGEAFDELRERPRPSGVQKLQGYEQLYRIRVGHYRVVYQVDDVARVIRITRVRHRREAYR